jgi:hypothetical protein
MGGVPGATGERPTGVTPPSGGETPVGERPEESQHADLDELAPMPPAPTLYPAGSKYYRVPVTFEVEILDANVPAAPSDRSARLRQPEGRDQG